MVESLMENLRMFGANVSMKLSKRRDRPLSHLPILHSFIRSVLIFFLHFQVGLHNSRDILMKTWKRFHLPKGFTPAALIPRKALLKVVNSIQNDGKQEAIPRAELSAYFGFEFLNWWRLWL